MRRGFCAGGLVLLFVGVLTAGCDYPTTPTGADDEELSHADPLDLAARATSPLIPPDLPPEIEGLPIDELLRAVIVGFPEPEAVGICHTQVASRSRPVPFRVHRLEVDIPQDAWEEAQGRSIYLQYRRYASNGRVLRVARCVVPASMVAVDHLFDRFSLRGVRATASNSGAVGAWEVRPISTWPPHARRLTLTLRGTTVMAAEDGGEDDGCVDGNNDPEEEPEDPCEMDEIVADGSECTNDDHERNEDGVCECSNGSDELDCYLEEEDEPCDPLFEPECPNDDDEEPGGGNGSDPDDSGDPDDCDSEEDEICEEIEEVSVSLSPSAVLPGGQTTVTVSVSPGGQGHPVEVWVEEVQYSGGHQHLGRPLGNFAAMSGSTDSTGVWKTTYTASAFGGGEQINAFVWDYSADATLDVRVPGLVSLPAGANYVKTGDTDYHVDNHYGTSGAVSALITIADAYAAEYPGSYLACNDMSLSNGGLFDIGPPYGPLWETPHAEHRFGTNADVWKGNVDSSRHDWLEARFALAGSPEFHHHASHWHLRF